MTYRRRDSGIWHADDFMLDASGSQDVSAHLQYILSTVMSPNDAFEFAPLGQYRCDQQISLTLPPNGVTILGNNAVLFGTAPRNSQFFSILGASNMTWRDLRIVGYNADSYTGAQCHPGTGSPTVVGTTRQLDAQNESVFLPRQDVTAPPWAYGRDKDWNVAFDLVLSDTTQVANDCVIVITDGYGTTLETITVPVLTGTPTTYHFFHRLRDPRDRMDIEVKKSTGNANAITITSLLEIRASTSRPSIEGNAGWAFGGGAGVRLFNCHVEGIGGDAIQASASPAYGFMTDTFIQNFVSRCCCRQGMSFNWNKRVRLVDFEVYFSGRSGIDIEPETTGSVVHDMTIARGTIFSPYGAAIAATNWPWIRRLNIYNVEMVDPGIASIFGGSLEGEIKDCRTTIFHRPDNTGSAGTLAPDWQIFGENMFITDCVADRGFYFTADAQLDENLVLHRTGGHVLDGYRINRQGNYGAVGVEPGCSVTVLPGSSNDTNPVPTFGRSGWHGAVGPIGGVRRGFGIDVSMHNDRLPASYGGGIASTHLWSPGGHDVVDEPMYRVRSISGDKGVPVTLQASTVRTTTGTTTGVDVGEATVCRFRQYITAISGTAPTLAVDVQQSHDNTTWTTIDSFPTVMNTTSTEYSKVIEFRNSARYLRLSYTLAGTSPSFTFSVIGDSVVLGNNLNAINVPVAASATTHAVTFPARAYANVNLVFPAGTTGGALTPSTTYYYRVAGRPLLGGPIVPLAEQSFTTGATHTAIQLGLGRIDQIVPGIHIAGFTVYRGTTPGVYTRRYDVLPITRFFTMASAGDDWSQILVDLGDTMNILAFKPVTMQTLGYPATISAKVGTFTPVDETGWELNTNYDVRVTINWASPAGAPYVSAKARTGFTINLPTAAPGDGSGRLSWEVMR